MKKFILTLLLIVFTGLSVFAQENYLHTIRLERTNNTYNVILGTDKMISVSKEMPSDKELVLVLTGITSSDKVDALYKGTNNIDSLIVENLAKNKIRVYISAPGIKDSTIMVEPENGQSTIVGESFPIDKAIWIACVLALFCIIFRMSKKVVVEDKGIATKKNIRDREIEIYKKYKKEIGAKPQINLKHDMRMKKMMKKIDRKIDQRLMNR